jgi:BirA family transcriptional regulator, biotin operon repressor / biotin---[acetyl-CoA-carboxylase] ligase
MKLSHRPNENGLVVIAREQSAGRGQHGRSWHAPPDSSVLMSVLLFPPPALRRPALLTAWAAVSVCDTTLKLANLEATIKWPNDVLVDSKKVCGILIEQRTIGYADYPLVAVVGIGLNVSQSTAMFEQAGLPKAASLTSTTGLSFVYQDVAKTLICQLDEQYHRLLDGDFRSLESLWKSRLGMIGQSVVVEGVRQIHRGRLLDMNLDAVMLDIGAGDVLRLVPESIRHIHPVFV